MEGVYDSDLVNRYSVNETSLSAIGCTSQSEAHRRGHRAILSNAKDGTVSFGVGLDGYIPLPAEIIGVADPFRAGKQNGGRVSAVNNLNIMPDRAVDNDDGTFKTGRNPTDRGKQGVKRTDDRCRGASSVTGRSSKHA
ncbi:hypothetical protein SY86_09500 [Erwinia tracheiphila]|uniref:Uncharacterized protein n=1 Tax=Erwinia tracheiphila TaxID=65700 RepID=A0A0M2K9K0_9GAMM|nr:hypothetical protein ETR_17227 [Erwinia tracheiphila PSU-1]KKF35609.1 hypothetical protein SY86_09500 [Erwinia tracheiphila]